MNIPMYFAYHMHSVLSNGTTNIDSITDFHDYIDAAKECGMTALGISEHGNMFNWLKKKEAIEPEMMSWRELLFTALPFLIVFMLIVRFIFKTRKERKLKS